MGGTALHTLIRQIDCPAESAQVIRDYCWGRHTESVTMAPLQHWLYFEKEQGDLLNGWDARIFFQYIWHPITTFVDVYKLPGYASSDCRPFIGHITRNSMTPSRVHFIEKDIILSKVKDLVDLISWTNENGADYRGEWIESNIQDLICYILGLYLNIDPSRILAFRAQKRSGTISHHVRSPNYREAIMPNTLSNYYQQFSGTSSTHQGLAGQGKHLAFNFLHAYCYGVFLISFPAQLGVRQSQDKTIYWIVTTPCGYCLKEIVESPIRLTSLPKDSLKRRMNAGKITERALQILIASLQESREIISDTRPPPDYLTTSHACQAIIQEFIFTTFHKRIQLLDHTRHVQTSEEGYTVMQGLFKGGAARQVSYTELVKIPAKDLAYGIAAAIYDHLTDFQGLRTHDEVWRYLATHPSSDLAWTFMISKLVEGKRLQDVLAEFNNQTGLPLHGGTNLLEGASIYFGSCSYKWFTTKTTSLPAVVHLSLHPIEDLYRLLRPTSKTFSS
ncbi:ORF2 [chu-like virus 1]|nr:ORF2 [chu-like virus 1]